MTAKNDGVIHWIVAARGLLLMRAYSPNESPSFRIATSVKLSSPLCDVTLLLIVAIFYITVLSSDLEIFYIMFFYIILMLPSKLSYGVLLSPILAKFLLIGGSSCISTEGLLLLSGFLACSCSSW